MNKLKVAATALLFLSLTPLASNAAKFLIQDIEEGPLSLQFRYVDGQLEYFRVENTTDAPIRVNLLGSERVLGKRDHIDFDPPKLDILHLSYGLYNEYPTIVNSLLPNRYSNTAVFVLPKSNNNTTGPITRTKY